MSALIVQAFENHTPCGEEYKYNDAYLAIENEIDKGTSISSGTGTDWKAVVDGSAVILQQHSKDLKLASWWLFGLWKLKGWKGLEEGLPLFNDLLHTFTTSLYPKSKKVKQRTIDWLETALTNAIFADAETIAKLKGTEALLDQFRSVEKAVQLTCENEEPFCRKIQASLKRIVDENSQAVKKEAPVSETAAVVTTSMPTQAQVTSVSSDSDAAKLLQSIRKSASLLADYWRERSFSNISAVRLNRMQSWLEVDELPVNASGKTLMNPPSETSIAAIQELMGDAKTEAAFEQLEKILKFSPFWFDGHYMVHELLVKEGAALAAKEVKHALIHFTSVFPETIGFTFNEGTPFASKKTKEWLGSASAAGIMEETKEEVEEETKDAVLQEAKALIKKNNIKEAMGLLHAQYVKSHSNVEKFRWRLAHAEMAIACGKKEIAEALIEDLEKKIDTHRLDEWQPELASQVYVLFLQSFTRQQVELEKLDAVYSRLCKIDSALAVDIKY